MKAWFRALWLSFYSQPFYREVAQARSGLCFRFLFAFSVIPALLFTLTSADLRGVMSRMPEIVTHAPELHYREGQIAIREKPPYNVYLSNESPLFAVVDTRYSEYGLEGVTDWMRDNHIALFLTATHAVVFNESAGRIVPINLKYIPADFVITQARWQALAAFVQEWKWPVLFFTSLIVTFISLALSALVMGVLGKIIAQCTGIFVDYPGVVRLAAVTSVPVWATTEIFGLFGPQTFISLLLARLGYLFVAIRANK